MLTSHDGVYTSNLDSVALRSLTRIGAVVGWGEPPSGSAMETNEDGDTVLTQWFERAVFEHHPDNPAEHQVLLRRLGVELLEHDQ